MVNIEDVNERNELVDRVLNLTNDERLELSSAIQDETIKETLMKEQDRESMGQTFRMCLEDELERIEEKLQEIESQKDRSKEATTEEGPAKEEEEVKEQTEEEKSQEATTEEEPAKEEEEVKEQTEEEKPKGARGLRNMINESELPAKVKQQLENYALEASPEQRRLVQNILENPEMAEKGKMGLLMALAQDPNLAECLDLDGVELVSSCKEALKAAGRIALDKVQERKDKLVDRGKKFKEEILADLDAKGNEKEAQKTTLESQKNSLQEQIEKTIEEIEELKAKLPKKEDLTEAEAKIDSNTMQIDERLKNEKALIKREAKTGFFTNLGGAILKMFAKEEPVPEDDKRKEIEEQLENGVAPKKGFFSRFRQAFQEEKKENKQKDEQEAERIKGINKETIEQLEREIEEKEKELKKAQEQMNKIKEVRGKRDELKTKFNDAQSQLDELAEEMTDLEDKKKKVTEMSNGKAVVKATLHDVKKTLGRFFRREREVGVER